MLLSRLDGVKFTGKNIIEPYKCFKKSYRGASYLYSKKVRHLTDGSCSKKRLSHSNVNNIRNQGCKALYECDISTKSYIFVTLEWSLVANNWVPVGRFVSVQFFLNLL